MQKKIGNEGKAKQQGCYRLLVDGLTIQLTGKDDLLLIQQAAQKESSPGDISYRQLSAAERWELDLPIYVAGWVNNISHQRLAESTIKLVMQDILHVLMYLPYAVIRLFV